MINGNNSYAQSIGTNMQNPEGVFLKEPVPAPDLIEKSITDNGDYSAKADGADGYSSVDVNVANSFTPADEGKVVSDGALIAQTAYPTEITENDTYDTTNYNSITVNVSGGGGAGGSDVIFYDYDGTIVTTYSAADFAELSAMPANPTHEGLTSQGWNWSLADAKTYVAAYGKLNIGQMYITSDGKTRCYCTITEDALYFELSLSLDDDTELDIDWGDGSEHTTWTSEDGMYSQAHEYSNSGNYTTVINVIRGSFSFSVSGDHDSPYPHKIELGTGVSGIYAYSYVGLTSITIPNSAISIGAGGFENCYVLSSVTIPNSVTTIEESTFYTCYALSSVTIPNSVTTIGSGAFSGCEALSSITIPSSVTSIGSSAFYDCSALPSITIPTICFP